MLSKVERNNRRKEEKPIKQKPERGRSTFALTVRNLWGRSHQTAPGHWSFKRIDFKKERLPNQRPWTQEGSEAASDGSYPISPGENGKKKSELQIYLACDGESGRSGRSLALRRHKTPYLKKAGKESPKRRIGSTNPSKEEQAG